MNNKLLKEYINQIILSEFKSNFNWNEFINIYDGNKFDITSYYIKYAKAHLSFLGEGSSRIVFHLPNTKYVLKIAKRSKGQAQNETEVDVYTNPSTKSIVSKIYRFDEKYYWIVSEVAREIKNNDEFFKFTGVDIKTFRTFLFNISNGNIDNFEEFLNFEIEKIEKLLDNPQRLISLGYDDSEIFDLNESLIVLKNSFNYNKEIMDSSVNLIKNGLLLYGDLSKLSSWGKTQDGRLVLLDYGFTKDVFSKHYQ